MIIKKTNEVKGWLKSVSISIDYNRNDSFYYLALLSAPILLTIYRYFTEAQDFMEYFPSLNLMEHGEIYAYILEYFSFFLLLFVIPVLILIYYKKSDLTKTLLAFPNFKKNIFWCILVIVFLIIPIAYNASSMPSVLSEYPLPKSLISDQSILWIYFLAYLLLYYLPWEFYFRGFLLFGLKNKYGAVAAILIQTISSCLVHIDKPAEEILGSIPFGILFGIIALHTRSIWYVVILHAALGIFTDWFIIF